jgi:hypothetical protein
VTEGEARDFKAIVLALEERFEVPAACGPKIRAALDRLVERGALVTANGAWVRPGGDCGARGAAAAGGRRRAGPARERGAA